MYKEFIIGKDLKHKNLIEYMHFVRIERQEDQEEEFHILLEYMEGGSLRNLLD